MTRSSCMKKSVITFSSFAIPSGSCVHCLLSGVEKFRRSDDLLITL